jgi:predicted nucleotidyltransferase
LNHDSISREAIIARLLATLEPLEQVLVVWEGGSAAFDRLDEFSDLDLYIKVKKGTTAMVLKQVEGSLESLSPIQIKYVPASLPWPGVSQAFYRLEGVPGFLLLDLALIEEGSPEQFLEVEVHGRAKIFLTRKDFALPHIDRLELIHLLEMRVGTIRDRFIMFCPFLEKEILRGNLIDALETYRRVFLDSLVALLRIRYYAPHHDFGAQRLQYELPESVMERLADLFLMKDLEDILIKSKEVRSWILDLLSEICFVGVDSLVDRSVNP